ncbi:LuxR C-terminal-related transcriptional regulator [Pseudomonas sp.]|uniref:LuxR C-terminal-related transcriptional regulator n=1 Tax=Pseudomonas sp. TaxID=306 RepID=UPI003A971F0A
MTDLSSLPGSSRITAQGELRFYRPPLPEGHVSRSRLCLRLEHGLQGRLLLVSAPAGFGKSSLAIEFCEHLPSNWQNLWLGLSERDSDPGKFLERLLLGLQQHYPNVGDEALGLLKMRQRHQPFAFEEWLDAFLDDLTRVLDPRQPLLLVLDDYHLAQGAVLDRCLQFLLNHLPSGMLLLVTSRQRPDWHLARLRLSQQLLELNEQDLRLTQDEISQLLSRQGASLPAEALAELCVRSEGWIAGLRLWLLAATDAGQLTDLHHVMAVPHGAQGLIREYLLEEVIERQPADVQTFLYDTARMDRFCAELCDVIRDSRDSASILDYLQTHQVFLVPLDEQGKWFRYHHLFSDLLRVRPLQSSEINVAHMHLRACRWFSAQGLLDEAIEQALQAGQPDVAANLVQSLSEEQLLAEQNVSALLRWKMDLPDHLLSSTSRLILLYSWALALACQLDAAEELAAQLSRFLPAPSDQQQRELVAQWLAISGAIARGRGDSSRAIEFCTAALAGLSHERYGPRLNCLSILANLAIVQGDLWRARGLNRDALELAQRIANPLFEALAYYDRARVLQARGEISRALAETRQGLELLRDVPAHRFYAARARLKLYEGTLLSLGLQPKQAASHLRAGIKESRACRDINVLIGYCVLASQEGREGRLSEAFALLSDAERLMHIWDVPAVYYLAMITLIKCELWLRQGQVELAEAWLERLDETYGAGQAATAPEYHPQLALHIDFHLAVLERIKGRVTEAERRLKALIQRAKTTGGQFIGSFAEVQLTLLVLHSGREQEAQQHLDNALEVAAGGGLLQFDELLVHKPKWLRGQLMARASNPVNEALLALLPALDPKPEVTRECLSLIDALSSREQAVLELIAKGCSNQEISERLFISLHTVKTHARHINSKLGVERRTQAVARANSLGLL